MLNWTVFAWDEGDSSTAEHMDVCCKTFVRWVITTSKILLKATSKITVGVMKIHLEKSNQNIVQNITICRFQ